MKSIILTYAPVNDTERKILIETKLFKIALNQHAEELKPNARIITDYILTSICQRFSQKIISVRDKLRSPSSRVEYFDAKFKGATILSAIDYLISKNYKEILIIGDNKVNNDTFKDNVNAEIDKIRNNVKIYQYTNGNFNLPIKTVAEFCKD